MNELIIQERLALMYLRSRADAGKSQDYMAKKLGVSKTTIQNWEAGTSAPNLCRTLEWFEVLGLPPMPYVLQLIYEDDFANIKDEENTDEEVEGALIAYVKGASKEEKRRLLYLLFGDHGSSTFAMLDLITAHLHTPLHDRIAIAQTVLVNYEMAEATGTLVGKKHVKPNIGVLQRAINNAKQAVINKASSYMIGSAGGAE